MILYLIALVMCSLAGLRTAAFLLFNTHDYWVADGIAWAEDPVDSEPMRIVPNHDWEGLI